MTPASVQILAALRSERTGLQALVEVLTHERNALGEGATDRLAEFASRKRELLLHIAHLGEQRNRLLERSGLTPNRRGMESWLQSHDRSPEALGEWKAFLDVAQTAHDLNRENGVFIDAGMRANQQALQTLMSAGAANSTYGPGGRSMNPIASRALASA